LSLIGMKNKPPLAIGGISEKKNGNNPNMIANGPGATALVTLRARRQICMMVERVMMTRMATANLGVLNLLSNSRNVYRSMIPKKMPDGVEKTRWQVTSLQSSS